MTELLGMQSERPDLGGLVSGFRRIPQWRLEGKMPLKLNLGCGRRRIGGHINIDSDPNIGADVVRDLSRGLPFTDSTVMEIQGRDVLEHLGDEFIFLMNECHRVLRADGLASFDVPNVLSKDAPENAFADPTHKRFMCLHSFDYFLAGHEQYQFNGVSYGILPWEMRNHYLLLGDSVLRVVMRPVKTATACGAAPTKDAKQKAVGTIDQGQESKPKPIRDLREVLYEDLFDDRPASKSAGADEEATDYAG